MYVEIPINELCQEKLKEQYGNSYFECQCFPRKFIIDITNRIQNQMKICQRTKYTRYFEMAACVVFSKDETDRDSVQKYSTFKVSLNMICKSGNTVASLDHFKAECIEEILERFVNFVDLLPTTEFIDREKLPPKRFSNTRFENLNNVRKIKHETSFVTLTSRFKEIFCEFFGEENVATSLGYELVTTDFCGICFDEIVEGENTGTALLSCGHLFCDECWHKHFRSRMNASSFHIVCPEYNCSEVVHESVLLTIVNVHDVLTFSRRKHETMLQSSGNIKYCPNPECCRIIKVSEPNGTTNIACDCGSQICFQCLNQSHWPVSCETANQYWKKLKRLGDDNLALDLTLYIKVRGKKCPQCKRFIEKQGGCFYMSCACGANFCWGCAIQAYLVHAS